jgi:hypothetical protein
MNLACLQRPIVGLWHSFTVCGSAMILSGIKGTSTLLTLEGTLV